MPKAKNKTPNRRGRPRRDAPKPFRYRNSSPSHSPLSSTHEPLSQGELGEPTNMNNDSGDDYTATLEARVKALESLITNRQKPDHQHVAGDSSTQPAPMDIDDLPAAGHHHSRSRERRRKHKCRCGSVSRRRHRRHSSSSSSSSSSSLSSSSSSSSSSDSESSTSSSDSDRGAVSSGKRPTTSFGLLLGHNVSTKLRQKILQEKFIDLAKLLPDHSLIQDGDLPYQAAEGQKSNKKKSITNISQWSEAFEIFTAVYTSKKSNRKKIQALLTYACDIRNMAKLNYDWLGYDVQFRVDRESTRCSWAEVRSDLHLIFRTPEPQPSTPFPPRKFEKSSQLVSPDGTIIPKGYCIKFHSRGQRCPTGNSCQYSHKCPSCAAFHPIYEKCGSYKRRFQQAKNVTRAQ